MKLKKFIKIYLLLAILFLKVPSISAQSLFQPDVLNQYQMGWDLMNRGLYRAALQCFQNVRHSKSTCPSPSIAEVEMGLLRQDALFYETDCWRILGNNSSDAILINFINKYPFHPKYPQACFMLGNSAYNKKEYEQSLSFLKKIEPLALSTKESSEVRFKQGLSYFELRQYDSAMQIFNKLKDEKGDFQDPSIYYFAYINYLRKDFDTALSAFERLKNSKIYASAYPYYKAAVLFLDERYDELIAHVKPIIKNENSTNNAELLKLLAQTYFIKSDYRNAALYYQKYSRDAGSDALEAQDWYRYGYSYFQERDYARAIIQLQKLEKEESQYGQIALMLLAESYLRIGDKSGARAIFLQASQHAFDGKAYKEEATMVYIKLSAELRAYPVVIAAGKEFLSDYPSSKYIGEINALIALAFFNTQNFQDAIDLLETISERTQDANALYQKATYCRGLQFYKERAFENAISAFMRSETQPVDAEIYALAVYWKGEAMFEVNKYGESTSSFETFISLKEAKNTSIYKNAFYALGYSAYLIKDYAKAAYNFDKYLKNYKIDESDSSRVADANLRLADSYFSIKDYENALKGYNRTVREHQKGEDYALFQRGVIYGLQNKIKEKISTHKTLIDKFPNSLYADDANFEIAYSYFLKGDNSKARDELLTLTNRYPQSPYVPKALITVGLAYYNDNQDNEALSVLKRLVKDYASSEESKQALKSIENIYVGQGDSDSFFEYLKNVPNAQYSDADKDNIMFQAVNSRFLKEDFEGAVHGVTSYLEKFKSAIHRKEAQFIRAESFVALGQDDLAITDYEEIVLDWTSQYTRKALLTLCSVFIKQKKYNEALPYLKKIETTSEGNKKDYEYAIYNLLDAYFALSRPDDLLHYAQIIRDYPDAPADKKILSASIMGKALYSRGDIVSAEKEFQYASKSKLEVGAESRYYLAVMKFNVEDYPACRKMVLDIDNLYSDYEYWVAKAFILLSQVHLKKEEFYQSKEILNSILKNYTIKGDNILEEAQAQLSAVAEHEQYKATHPTVTTPNDEIGERK